LAKTPFPYLHGWQTGAGKSMREFTWMFQLTRGASSSDLKGDVAGIAPGSRQLPAYQNHQFPVISPSNYGQQLPPGFSEMA